MYNYYSVHTKNMFDQLTELVSAREKNKKLFYEMISKLFILDCTGNLYRFLLTIILV